MPPDEISLAEAMARAGSLRGDSDWLSLPQERIDGFAAVTGDDSFIHVDPALAARTRFGGTIAHGLLVLSLLPLMLRTALPVVRGQRMAVNYGFDRVRFIAPVPAGSQVRGHFLLDMVEQRKPGLHVFSYDVRVEARSASSSEVLTSRWLIGRWFPRQPATQDSTPPTHQ
jgi:acyl dehydratase